jgi:hypothetical protein
VELGAEDSDALLVTLEGLPWWSTNPKDYPHLLLTSRKRSTVPILLKLGARKLWKTWTFLDKFSFLVCTLAAAAPIINEQNPKSPGNSTQDSIASIIRILNEITELLDTERKELDDEEEIGQVFVQEPPKSSRTDDQDSYKGDSSCSESDEEEPSNPPKRKRGRPRKASSESPRKKTRLSANAKKDGDAKS